MFTPLLIIITANLILSAICCYPTEISPPICPYDGVVTDEWIIKTYQKNYYMYENGTWSYGRVKSVWQYATMKDGLISFNTNNYTYPLLSNISLPIEKSFLGIFKLPNHDWTSHDVQSFLQYFKEGTLSVYRWETDRTVWLKSARAALGAVDPGFVQFNNINKSFSEWYNSWESLDAFKHYKQLYVHPDKFNDPSWATIRVINKYSQCYINSELLNSVITDVDLSSSRDFTSFSTVDFVVSGARVPLYEVEMEVWSDLYTAEQAMYRYWDYENEKIGFWTPDDLFIASEIKNISSLLEQDPVEITTIISSTLIHTGETLIFNHVDAKKLFMETNMERSIEYVC